jgi:hypothetical protein
MSQAFRVRATSLNLRSAPDLGAAVLASLPRGALAIGVDAAPDANGWLRVTASGRQGYVKASFLDAVDPGTAPSAGASPPVSPTTTSAIDVDAKSRNTALLHPEFRRRADNVISRLQADGIPFRIFEAFRHPERQAHLYRQGREDSGSIVTKARAWQSFHQYGLAADFVLFDPTWTWDTTGERGAMWRRMHEIGTAEGLRALDFELPHLELAVDLDDLHRGVYPAGGDESWADNLATAIRRWSGTPAAPPPMDERPPLTP